MGSGGGRGVYWLIFFFQAEDGIRDKLVTGVQTCALPISLEEEERAQRRRIDLEEQRSNLNPPKVRIRAWEKVHGLRLPDDSTHPILEVIAGDTRLTLAEVQEEQQERAAEATSRRQKQPNGTTNAAK